MPTNLTDRLGELVDKVTPGPCSYDGGTGYGNILGHRVRADSGPTYVVAVALADVPELAEEAEANAEYTALCFTHKDEILSALRKAEDGWLSIESAPKDGSVILLTSTSPLWKYPLPAEWHKKQDRWVFADEPLNDVWAVSDLVTHWMPLPAPPTTGGSND